MTLVRVDLPEWTEKRVPGVSLSPWDRAFVEGLGENDGARIVIDEMREGVRVRSKAWVGIIQLETVQICVVPKLAGENLGLVEMLEFAYGLDGLRPLRARRTIDTTGSHLLDVIAQLFAESVDALLRRGLLADYREREQDLPAVRGRILGDRQILRRFGQIDRLECRFDEHEHDIDENRLIGAALNVCARRVAHQDVKRHVRHLRSVFDEVCDPTRFNPAAWRGQLVYHRMNEHYRDPHALAWLILDAIGIRDVLETGKTRCFAFLIDMNRLFERFVLRLMEILVRGRPVRVRYQHPDWSIIWDASAQRPYARVVPDILVERRDISHACLAIDAKYKAYDDRKIASEDIYQSFLYAFAYGGETHGPRPALLLYPATQAPSAPLRLRIRDARSEVAEVAAVGVHIPTVLAECRRPGLGPSSKLLTETVEGMFLR